MKRVFQEPTVDMICLTDVILSSRSIIGGDIGVSSAPEWDDE